MLRQQTVAVREHLVSPVAVMGCHGVGDPVDWKAAQYRVMEKTVSYHDILGTGYRI